MRKTKVDRELLDDFLSAKSSADRLDLISGFEAPELRKLAYVLELRLQKEAVAKAPEIAELDRGLRKYLACNPDFIKVSLFNLIEEIKNLIEVEEYKTIH